LGFALRVRGFFGFGSLSRSVGLRFGSRFLIGYFSA